jgi:hypothetical protein
MVKHSEPGFAGASNFTPGAIIHDARLLAVA